VNKMVHEDELLMDVKCSCCATKMKVITKDIERRQHVAKENETILVCPNGCYKYRVVKVKIPGPLGEIIR